MYYFMKIYYGISTLLNFYNKKIQVQHFYLYSAMSREKVCLYNFLALFHALLFSDF